MNTTPVTDPSDATPLYKPLGLYLKPLCRLHITVTLPQIKVEGLTVSNWALMEKVKQVAAPTRFVLMRVKLSTVDFVRFEAELEHSSQVDTAIQALNDQTIKIGGFTQPFKTKAKKASTDFPTKQQWESHFLENAEHYDETKPGERPDTILFKDIPKRFFAEEGSLVPHEDNIKLAFLTFGQVRALDVPMLNADHEEDATLAQTALIAGGAPGQSFNAFSMTGTGLNFDFFVQFNERIGFERCMDEFRDMKLMHVDNEGKAVAASIKIQFDKAKHLSEAKMLQREQERKKLQLENKKREEERHKKREEEERKLAEKERIRAAKDKAKEERRLQRQAKRKERRLRRKHRDEAKKLQKRVQLEERKLTLAQRKLESTRILEKLFDRVAKIKEAELAKKLEAELEAEKKRIEEKEKKRKEKEDAKEKSRIEKEKARMEKKEQELKEQLLKQVGQKRGKEMEKDKNRKDDKSRSRGEKSSRDDDRKRDSGGRRETNGYGHSDKRSRDDKTDKKRSGRDDRERTDAKRSKSGHDDRRREEKTTSRRRESDRDDRRRKDRR